MIFPYTCNAYYMYMYMYIHSTENKSMQTTCKQHMHVTCTNTHVRVKICAHRHSINFKKEETRLDKPQNTHTLIKQQTLSLAMKFQKGNTLIAKEVAALTEWNKNKGV